MKVHAARKVSPKSGGLAAAAGLALCAATGAAVASEDLFATMPASITLNGVVRDFKEFSVPGGHPDFEQYNDNHRVGLAAPELGEDGKPVFGARGMKVGTQFKDAQGRNINPALYDSSRGDRAGTLQTRSNRTVYSAESFAQWYRDVPGVNASMPHAITLERVVGTNRYKFDAGDNGGTPEIEGFFPIDGQLFGNSPGTVPHNYHFTYELATRFTFRRGSGQVFTFTGDDDVFVYIGGRLAIDVGGVHSAISQTIDLDRLSHLEDGQDYDLNFFFAERHRSRSNCRIETTLELRNVELPATTALHD